MCVCVCVSSERKFDRSITSSAAVGTVYLIKRLDKHDAQNTCQCYREWSRSRQTKTICMNITSNESTTNIHLRIIGSITCIRECMYICECYITYNRVPTTDSSDKNGEKCSVRSCIARHHRTYKTNEAGT